LQQQGGFDPAQLNQGNQGGLSDLMQGAFGQPQGNQQPGNNVGINQGLGQLQGQQQGQLSLSDDDMASVQRLMQLGFEYGQSLEAYMACAKNEELAANFLFDNPTFGNN